VREIKFRSWDKGAMRMTVYDFAADSVILSRLHVAMFADAIREPGFDLMQYTGLKDKNGKDIYEGDVVQGIHGKYPVAWNDERAAFEARIIGFASIPSNQWKEVEIIGNIYENPELLTDGK